MTMAAKTVSLHAAKEFVRKGALEANLPEARLGELDLVIEEVFMNVCCHAYASGMQGIVILTYSVPAPGQLSVEVADQGAEFNPLTAAPALSTLDLESLPIGGFGILLVKTLAASLTYRRDCGWNRLTFGISAGS
jgi:anti-sigma regulatory factor (Ser/Thr protein kinase)